MTLASYERNWQCLNCCTVNAPDYERCQECHADQDGENSTDESEEL